MDPLGLLGPLALLDPLGPLGPLALLDPLGPLGPLALNRFFLKALSEHWTCLRRELVFQFWTWS